MGNLVINIAKDFSRCPGARYRAEGDFAGEEFRESYLVPRIKDSIENRVKLVVVLDGSAGYSTAFLEEAFGGLVRENKFTLQQLSDTLVFISDEDPTYIEDIWLYIEDAWEHR